MQDYKVWSMPYGWSLLLTSNEVNSHIERDTIIDKSVGHCALVETTIKDSNTAHLQKGPDKSDSILFRQLFSYINSVTVLKKMTINAPRDGGQRESRTHTHGYQAGHFINGVIGRSHNNTCRG